MDTPCGIRGAIKPELRDFKQSFKYRDIFSINIENSLLEIGYEKNADKEVAKKIGQSFIQSWTIRHGFKIEVDFNQSWETTVGQNKAISTLPCDTIKVHSGITTTVTITGIARIIKQTNDSFSFLNDIEMVKKCEVDETLSKSLKYYYDEVSANPSPLYGIYKVIESMSKKLGNHEILARLLNKSKKYVGDITETSQIVRHAKTHCISKLTEQECKIRTEKLLNAYADTIKLRK